MDAPVRNKHIYCPKCTHPLFSEGPYPNKDKDEEGDYIICSVCGEKIYLNKTKE